MTRPSLLQRFLNLDRRWMFLLEAAVVVFALVGPFGIGVRITKPVNDFYRVIHQSDPSKPLLVAVDTPPAGLPELEPMIVTILRHAFSRGQPVILISLQMEGVAISERLLNQVTGEINDRVLQTGRGEQLKSGVDYALLGFRAGFSSVIISLGEEIRSVFPNDFYGTPLETMPLFQDTHNYDDMAAAIDISWSSTPEAWVEYAGVTYGVPILVGCTAVSAPQYYAYLQTGQMAGLLGGLKGAAEYERITNNPGSAGRGMVAQLGVHALLVLAIVLGNLAFFADRFMSSRRPPSSTGPTETDNLGA
ncbi:MAG TPA: hypothetical protein VM054_02840 [bacterium]|nr:hypothetical protein [bacterium]